MALSDKARAGQLVVLESLELPENKTKDMAKVLKALGVTSSVLLVCDGAATEVIRAARNIPRAKTLPADLLNTVDLINARKVVMTLDAVYKAEQLWGGNFVRKKVVPGDVAVDAADSDDESGGN
jgi:large subunit ribosomal protein L4